MYVCLCHALRERHVREAAAGGSASVGAVLKTLGVRPQCAKCVPRIRELVGEPPGAVAPLEEPQPTL